MDFDNGNVKGPRGRTRKYNKCKTRTFNVTGLRQKIEEIVDFIEKTNINILGLAD